MAPTVPSSRFIRWFADIGIGDIPLVGGKNASLGEMVRELAPQGVKVPDGFAITAEAYRCFLKEAGLDQQIHDIVSGVDTRDLNSLRSCGSRVRHLILAAEFPKELEQAIVEAYEELGRRRTRGPLASPVDVAVRSSATAEDLPDASFAGQQETARTSTASR